MASGVCSTDTHSPAQGSPATTMETGTTLLEMILVVAIMATLAGMAVPMLLTAQDEVQAVAAARYLTAQGMLARSRAARTGAAVGLHFERDRDGYRWTRYMDGDGDGIRMADVARGVDRRLGPEQRLEDLYPSVRFELGPSVPAIGGSSSAAGSDPIRLGRSDILTFSPLGTATSGTLYLRSRSGDQYAVRVLGTTGRLRTLRYDDETGRWRER